MGKNKVVNLTPVEVQDSTQSFQSLDDILNEATETTPVVEIKEETEVAQTVEPQHAEGSIEAIMAELGLGIVTENETVELPTREPKQKAPKATKEPKPKKEKASKEEKAKAPKAPPIDAPIPLTIFRNLTIGYYGNVLEELEEADVNGYNHCELKLERYDARSHESFRNSNGRMALLVPQGGSTYLVVAENTDGTIEPVIEVTNGGRGRLRCRQIAQVLQLAYTPSDEKIVDLDTYNELKSKIKLI